MSTTTQSSSQSGLVQDPDHVSGHGACQIGTIDCFRMYRQMVAIREFEQQANDLYMRALMPGLTHLYEGRGSCRGGHLRGAAQPTITSPARIAATGIAWRKARSPTACSPNCSARKRAIAAAKAARCTSPTRRPATWARTPSSAAARESPPARRFAAKRLGNGRVCVCFFGEGALGQGVLYEVMNIAALWKLPVIYVCENNMYNEYTHYSETTAGDMLGASRRFRHSRRKRGWTGRARRVYAAAKRIVEHARARAEGPGFLLCNTYRYRGHHVGDINREYYRAKTGRAGVEVGSRSDQASGPVADRAESWPTPGGLRKVHGEGQGAIWKQPWNLRSPRPIPESMKWSRTSMPETQSSESTRSRQSVNSLLPKPSAKPWPRRCAAIPRLHYWRRCRRSRHAVQSALRPGRGIRQRPRRSTRRSPNPASPALASARR